MGSLKFTRDSILDFYCPYISGDDIYQKFDKYIELTGIPAEDGFYDVDDFLVDYCATTPMKKNLISTYTSFYRDESGEGLFAGYRYDIFPNFNGLGYITLPFMKEGVGVKLVLPGTMPQLRTLLSNVATPGTGTIKRTKEKLILTKPDGTITEKTASEFPNGVVPLYISAIVVGGGGGGSCTSGLVAGRGGGGAGTAAAILPFVHSDTYTFQVAAGGTGGYRPSGIPVNTTSPLQSGNTGGTSSIKDKAGTVFISGYGGTGAPAGTTTCPSGGGYYNAAPYDLYKKNGTVFEGHNGGSGSVDLNLVGSNITTYKLATNTYLTGFVSDILAGSGFTFKPGATYSGGGGGATWVGNGGTGAAAGTHAADDTDGYGTGGGGGGYQVGYWYSGGDGSDGSVRFYY